MSWLPRRDKLDPVQASAVDVAAMVRELDLKKRRW